jgi:hypothetical protein
MFMGRYNTFMATWFLHCLSFSNRVMRRISGPKRYEITGEWRELHNEELNDLYSQNIILLMK